LEAEVGEFGFVGRAVGAFDDLEGVALVELEGGGVGGVGPELEGGVGELGEGEEFGADAAALEGGEDVEVVDGAVGEGDEAGEGVVDFGEPDLVLGEDLFAEEVAVLVFGVEG
jgi:hypothetical protein